MGARIYQNTISVTSGVLVKTFRFRIGDLLRISVSAAVNALCCVMGIRLRVFAMALPAKRAFRERRYRPAAEEVFRAGHSTMHTPAVRLIGRTAIESKALNLAIPLTDLLMKAEADLSMITRILEHVGYGCWLLHEAHISAGDVNSSNILVDGGNIYLIDLEFASGLDSNTVNEESFDVTFQSDILASLLISGFEIAIPARYRFYCVEMLRSLNRAGCRFSIQPFQLWTLYGLAVVDAVSRLNFHGLKICWNNRGTFTNLHSIADELTMEGPHGAQPGAPA